MNIFIVIEEDELRCFVRLFSCIVYYHVVYDRSIFLMLIEWWGAIQGCTNGCFNS